MAYHILRMTWTVYKWIWGIAICGALINLIIGLALLPVTDLPKTILVNVLQWLFTPGVHQSATSSTIAVFIVTTFIFWVFVHFREGKGNKVLKNYLDLVWDQSQQLNPWENINPKVRSQQVKNLLPMNISLSDIFIYLQVARGSVAYELDDNQEASSEQNQSNDIRNILQQRNADHPVAILLGGPGSGKSTTLRWFALHMAHASQLWFYPWRLFYVLTRVKVPYCQIPILLRISDYANYMSQHKEKREFPFEEFFEDQSAKLYLRLPDQDKNRNLLFEKLMLELDRGHCLILLDGLNEVIDNQQRKDIVNNINAFISRSKRRRWYCNRFIITTRTEGYNQDFFASHYTLQNLKDPHIKHFLVRWYSAFQRNKLKEKRDRPTQKERTEAQAIANTQREILWKIIENNHGIRELKKQPFTLTMLAGLHCSNVDLPSNRTDLYQTVTRFLLSNQLKKMEQNSEEIRLAEQLLSELAFHLHKINVALNKSVLDRVALEIIAEFSQQQHGTFRYTVDMISDEKVQELIKLICDSGLLVIYAYDNNGQELFRFRHPAFEDYFVALYLVNQKPTKLAQLFIQYSRSVAWHEPLGLVIAWVSQQSKNSQAGELIRVIADSGDKYDDILYCNLFTAIEIMLDSHVSSVDKQLSQDLAQRIFDLYGDFLGKGRYTPLRRKIEEVIQRWLDALPRQKTEQDDWRTLPLLETWHTALCNSANPARQEGAVRLLAAIIHKLDDYSKLVYRALVPPLLLLTQMHDWPSCPPRIKDHLSSIKAQAASPRIEEYAFIALRLLDKDSPAHWLYTDWLEWGRKQPVLLVRLTQHSYDLSRFMTPASLPGQCNNTRGDTYDKIIATWKQYDPDTQHKRHKVSDHSLSGLQIRSLAACDRARYPLAHLYKRMLDRELAPSAKQQDWDSERVLDLQPSMSAMEDWGDKWIGVLQEEMARGCSATYQQSLALRLLLYQRSEQQRNLRIKLAIELQDALLGNHRSDKVERLESGGQLVATPSVYNRQQVQALMAITSMHLLATAGMSLEKVDIPERQLLYYLQSLIGSRYLRNLLDLLDLPVTSYIAENFTSDLAEISNLRTLQEIQTWLDTHIFHNSQNLPIMQHLDRLLDMQELSSNSVFDTLCHLLKQPVEAISSTVLLALYAILANKREKTMVTPFVQGIQESIETFRQQAQPLRTEHRLLTEAIVNLLNPSSPDSTSSSKDEADHSEEAGELAAAVHALRQRQKLSAADVELLLEACTNTTKLSGEISVQVGADTAQKVVWGLITRQFNLHEDHMALNRIVRALDNENTTICAVAALLLQHCVRPPDETCKELAKKVRENLEAPDLSFRLLDVPDTSRVWLLDDVLFKALEVLVE